MIVPRKKLGYSEQVTLPEEQHLLSQQSGGLKFNHLLSIGQ